jgi:dipeptide/tripeptide permease
VSDFYRGFEAWEKITDWTSFLAYTVPLLGGWVADTKWGRYRTICVGVAICGVAHFMYVLPSQRPPLSMHANLIVACCSVPCLQS